MNNIINENYSNNTMIEEDEKDDVYKKLQIFKIFLLTIYK